MTGSRKFIRDFFLIFYDDLDFKAMSLPRIGAGVLTAVVIVSWYADQSRGRRFDDLNALAALCGGVWAGYAFKKWTGRGESSIQCDDIDIEDDSPEE